MMDWRCGREQGHLRYAALPQYLVVFVLFAVFCRKIRVSAWDSETVCEAGRNSGHGCPPTHDNPQMSCPHNHTSNVWVPTPVDASFTFTALLLLYCRKQ